MRKKEHPQDNPDHAWQKADARILGQILAAQNVVFALPDSLRIAEFYAQILMTIPGITGCRVCLGAQSVQAGEMTSDLCTTCATLRHFAQENGTLVPTSPDFKCTLAEQPDLRVIAIDTHQHHFGFFVVRIDQGTLSELYQPFISNLSGYVALVLENRWQKDLLQKANEELERKVAERTHELLAANEELSAYRGKLEDLVQKRTAELEAANQQLARMNKLFVGRELRMVELKEQIRLLEQSSTVSRTDK